MRIEAKLEELGLVLPEPMQAPSGLQLPFSWVRVNFGELRKREVRRIPLLRGWVNRS